MMCYRDSWQMKSRVRCDDDSAGAKLFCLLCAVKARICTSLLILSGVNVYPAYGTCARSGIYQGRRLEFRGRQLLSCRAGSKRYHPLT
jgi:hypothetical protein